MVLQKIEKMNVENYNLRLIYAEKISNFDKYYAGWDCLEINKNIVKCIKKFTRNGKSEKEFNINHHIQILFDFKNHYHADTFEELLNETNDEIVERIEDYVNFMINKATKKNFNASTQQMYETDKKYKPSTIKNGVMPILRSFYRDNGHKITDSINVKTDLTINDEVRPTREIMGKVYNQLKDRNYRVLFKFYIATGFRAMDLINELTKEVDNHAKYKLKIYNNTYYIPNFGTNKEGIPIPFIFLPTELIELLKSVYNLDDITQLDFRKLFMNTKGRRIDHDVYLKGVKLAFKKTGIEGNFTIHTIRKYFEMQLGNAGLEDIYRESLLGHSLGLKGRYDLRYKDIKLVYEQFLKSEPFLSLESIVINKMSEEMIELKHEHEMLKMLVQSFMNRDQSQITSQIAYTERNKDVFTDLEEMKNKNLIPKSKKIAKELHLIH